MIPDFSAIQNSVELFAGAWLDSAKFGKKSLKDAEEAPPSGGVYVFRRTKDKAAVYVGESGNLRSRLKQRYMKKAESTLTSAIRRQQLLREASIAEVRDVLIRDYEFDYLPVPFGRREIEAFLQKKLKIKEPNQTVPTITAAMPVDFAVAGPSVIAAPIKP